MIGETKPGRKPQRRGRGAAIVLLGGFALLGATVPQLLPLDLNARYTAAATLAPTQGPAHLSALPHDMETLLAKPQVMDLIVQALARSGRDATAQPSVTGFLRDLLTGEAMTMDRSDAVSRARLHDMLKMIISPDRKLLTLTATAGNAGEAADLANTAAEVLQQEMKARPAPSQDDPVERARMVLEQAQVALDNLPVSEADLAKARQQESQRFQLMADSESVRAQQQSLDERLRLLGGLKVGQLMTQAFPNALRGTPLEMQRQAYLDASLRVDQLAVSLGPKHPTLMAAQGAADEARAALSKALAQTLAEANQKKAALDAEVERLRAGLAQLEASAVPDAVRQHQDLQQAVETARKSYLDALRAERQAPAPGPRLDVVRIASAQDVVVAGLPGWLYSLMGALAGLCLGGACLPATGRTVIEDMSDDTAYNEDEAYLIEPQILPQVAGRYLDEEEQAEVALDRPLPVNPQALSAHPVFEDDHRLAAVDDKDEDGWDADEGVRSAAALFADVANDDRSHEWLTALLEANVQIDPPQLPPLLERALVARMDREPASAEPDQHDDVSADVAELEALLEQLAILRRELAAAQEREIAA